MPYLRQSHPDPGGLAGGPSGPPTLGPSATALIEGFDWSSTPLGARESWPSSLETALSLCLASPLPTVIWWGPDLIQLYNQAFARYLGERHPMALGQPARECWADIWDVLAPPVEAALRGRSSTIELDPEQAPSQRQTSMLFAPIQDGSGQAAGVWHCLLELERRSRAAAASRLRARESFLSVAGERLFHEASAAALRSEESLSLLDTVFRTAPVGLAFLDRELRYVRINEALAALDGHSVEEHLGAPLGSVWPESAPTLEPLFHRVFETGEPIRDVELRLPGEEGLERHRYFQASYYPVRGADGHVAWVGAVISDITQRQLIEDALRESNERYGALAQAVPAILFSTGADGSCDYVSEQFTTYTGLPASAAQGFAGLELVHPEDVARSQAQWLESVRTGLPFEVEFRLRRHDGVYRWFRCCCSPMRDAEGQVVKWFGLTLDIHDEREAGEAMQQAQKLESIGLLAGGIAHDFNNLLTGILGNASLALRVLPKLNPARELVHDVVIASQRAAALTGQLLAYAGKGRFNIEPVNLSAMARDMGTGVRAFLQKPYSSEQLIAMVSRLARRPS